MICEPPKSNLTAPRKPGPVDIELAERVARAVAELEDVMDAALLAGLVVEPEFTRVENRVARYGTRIDSFVCSVSIFRKLT